MTTFGSDPEFPCMFSTETGIIPPAALIADYKVPFYTNLNNKRVLFVHADGEVIEDGAAVELNVNPCDSLIEVAQKTKRILEEFKFHLYNVHNLSVEFPIEPIGYFNVNKYWKGRDVTFHDCVRFGCDPDIFPEYYLEIGLEKEKPQEIDVSKHPERYFAAHIHIGTNVNFNVLFSPIVFDFTLGLANSMAYRKKDQREKEIKRLQYYGHPGRCRLQKHGYEYRPPSNFWLTAPSLLVNFMEKSINLALKIIDNGLERDFFFFVKDDIPNMWDISLNLASEEAKNLYINKVISFCLDNNLIKLSEIKDQTNIGYI